MLQNTANIVEAVFRKVRITVTSESWLAVFPDRLVTVHARAIVAKNRLRHERGRFAKSVRHIVDRIFVDLKVISNRCECLELHAQLVLSGRHFVVMLFDFDAHFSHRREHFRPQVLCAVDWVYWEVTTLCAGTVTHIAHFILGAHIVRQFDTVEHEACVVWRGREAHVIKDEEFCFRAEINCVTDAGALQIRFSALSCATRVAVIKLACVRLDDVTEDGECCLSVEWVDGCGGAIWHQHHVGLIDRFPASDRRAVEHLSIIEEVFVFDHRDVEGHVLHFSAWVSEPKVHIFHVFVFDCL